MRKQKTAALILSAVMTLSLSGCGSILDNTKEQYIEIYNDPIDQIVFELYNTEEDEYYDNDVSASRLTGKHKEFAEKCFSDIEIFGARLSLPMNVSDLPEGFSVELEESKYDNRFYTENYKSNITKLMFEGKKICTAEIIYSKDKGIADGQITTLDFNFFTTECNAAKLGGESIYFTYEKMTELFGENGSVEGLDMLERVYYLPDGKCITIQILEPSYDNGGLMPFNVMLSTSGKTFI